MKTKANQSAAERNITMCHVKFLSHLFQSPRPSVIQAESQPEYLLFPVRQRVKHFHKLLMQQSKRGRIQGHLHMVILDKISAPG